MTDTDGYDARDDVEKCFAAAYADIRARVAAGGKDWTPPECQCPACQPLRQDATLDNPQCKAITDE